MEKDQLGEPLKSITDASQEDYTLEVDPEESIDKHQTIAPAEQSLKGNDISANMSAGGDDGILWPSQQPVSSDTVVTASVE